MSAELGTVPSGAVVPLDPSELRMQALRRAAGELDRLFDAVGDGPWRYHVRAARSAITRAIVAAHTTPSTEDL